MMFDIILQAKKLIFFGFCRDRNIFRYTKINDLSQILVQSGAGAEPEPAKFRSKGAGVGTIKGK